MIVVCADPGAGSLSVRLRKPGEPVPSAPPRRLAPPTRYKWGENLTRWQLLVVVVGVGVVGRLTHRLGSSVSNATWARDLSRLESELSL